MTNLSDFLLARIAEAEEQARKRMHHAQENHLLLQDPKYLGRVIPGWYEWPEIEADAARVLAECDAKRDIVRDHPGYGGICGTCGVLKPDVGERWPCRTLRLLSFPYIDHPDYRQEWRP